MFLKLNDEQSKAAMSDKKTVIVSAGAGSGKTAVLTSRYLWLIDICKISPESILTLTFTKKAALEMRERILDMLGDDNQYLRQQVLRAQICTVHSFCEEILREYALEAGIDPAYRVLDEAESLTLLYTVFDILKHKIWILADTDDKYKEIQKLFFDYNIEKLQSEIFDLYRNLSTRGISIDKVSKLPDISVDCFKQEIISDIDSLIVTENNINDLEKDILSGIREILLKDLEGLDDILLENFSKSFKKIKNSTVLLIIDKVYIYKNMLLNKKIHPYLQASINLLIDIETTYNEEKTRRGLIDYNDMMILTRKLLNDDNMPGIRESYQRKYKHIMVDEFQDTSFLQYDIMSSIRGDANLFLVGDVKQSIYGFNGSDIKLYTDVEKNILADDDSERVVMSKNYRTQQDIIEIINSIFIRRWPLENKSENLFEYEELDAMLPVVNSDSPKVELVSLFSESNVEELRRIEAHWISKKILNMVESSKINFSDILILLRSTTDVKIYEDELATLNIPCYVVKGRGFYKSIEIRDIIAMINCAINPMDTVALATVLRSPMVKLSDDSMYWLINDRRDESNVVSKELGRMWIRLNNYVQNRKISKNDKYKIEKFLSDLHKIQSHIPEGNPIAMIDAILKYTGYTQVLLMSENGLQKYANLMKFREVATEFNARGIFDLKEFTRYIDLMEKYMNKEAAAPMEAEKSNVVKIMTIHAAKGLEAPVVFLADASRTITRSTKPLYLYKSDCLMMKYYDMDRDEYFETDEYLDELNEIRNKDLQEEARLLYVALTRAKDKLLIVGSGNNKESYLKMIKDLSGIDDLYCEEDRYLYVNDDNSLKISLCSSLSDFYLKTQKVESYYNIIKKNIRMAEKTEISPAQSEIRQYTKKIDRFSLTIKDLYKMTNFGVSRILTYSSCPLKYWFQYFLNPDNSLRDEVYEIDDINDEPHGAEFGTKFHYIMQHLPFNDRVKNETEIVLDEILAKDENQVLSVEERKKILGYLKKISSLPVFVKLKKATKIYRELGFVLNLNGFTIPGYIDLAAQCDDGWWVIDYKTGSKSLSRHTNQMFIYMIAMRNAIGVNPVGSSVIYVDNSKPEYNIYFDESRMAEIEKLIVSACMGMTNDIFSPKPDDKCQYCTYKNICSYLPDNDGQLVMDYGIF